MAQTDQFYSGIATQSVRFDRATSAFLNETAGTPTDSQKWTASMWIKRGGVMGAEMGLIASNGAHEYLRFESNDTLRYRLVTGGDQRISMITSPQLRDASAWYHIVCAVDLSNTTDNDKAIIYVNGTRQALATNITTTTDTYDSVMLTSGNDILLGEWPDVHFDGYMSEVNFIDGLQLAASSFAETKNGVWIPKDTSGLTFGNNGFRLEFKGTGTSADASGIGADTSGKTNHFSVNNIGSHDSAIPDCPENNFCTMNPLYGLQAQTLTEGSLKAVGSSTTYRRINCTFGVSSGKWYYEARVDSTTANNPIIGWMLDAMADGSNHGTSLGTDANEIGLLATATGQTHVGKMMQNNTLSSSYFSELSAGDIIGVALDLDNQALYISLEGTFINSGNPASGASKTGDVSQSAILANRVYIPCISNQDSNSSVSLNFGQNGTFNGQETAGGNADANGYGNFINSCPSGYLSLCSANLSEPTIGPNSTTNCNEHFDTVLYTASGSAGDGAGAATAQDIGGLNFKPDVVWIKGRSYVDYDAFFDSSRGTGKIIGLGRDAGEEGSYANTLDEFRSDGFGVGADSTAQVNWRENTYVAWCWKANGGTTTTNDASATSVGDLDSVYQANTTAGFSIFTFTGDGDDDSSIAHGLGAIPHFYFIKDRETNEYGQPMVHHQSLASTHNLFLSGTEATNNGGFPSGNATSSILKPAVTNYTNVNTNTYFGCAWTEIEGFSKFGKYVGNSSTDGTYVYTGFRPALVCIKLSSASGENWIVWDNKRDIDNVAHNKLYWDHTPAEITDTTNRMIDMLSNGFKHRADHVSTNTGGTYVYMAWAEMPFKYANAR